MVAHVCAVRAHVDVDTRRAVLQGERLAQLGHGAQWAAAPALEEGLHGGEWAEEDV